MKKMNGLLEWMVTLINVILISWEIGATAAATNQTQPNSFKYRNVQYNPNVTSSSSSMNNHNQRIKSSPEFILIPNHNDDQIIAANMNQHYNYTAATTTTTTSHQTNGMCITWWDGIYQWPPTPVNTTISIECHKIFEMTMGEQSNDREFLYQQKHHYAERKCLANGQWGWNNWTNYTECLNLLAQQEKETSKMNYLQSIISYVVLVLLIASLVSLIISIVIFQSFKPLQCLRIRVHKNLCVALLMNCSLYIIMNSLVGIHRIDLSVQADWFCKTLKCLNVYSSMATINWMFVEGFLFHRRLYAPFHTNTKLYLIGYYSVGWLLPAICVLAWSLSLEFASNVSDKPCWEGYRVSNTIFIVSTPMMIAVGINFLFLISIIRILITKLRADTSKSDQATIKAIKATALLIPLLGIHHLIVLYNPSTFNRKLVNVYIVLNVLFQSVQGIIVAVLYCFTNNEVRTVLNAAWSRRRMSHSAMGNGGMSNVNLNGSHSPMPIPSSQQHLLSHQKRRHQTRNNNNNNNNNLNNSPNLSTKSTITPINGTMAVKSETIPMANHNKNNPSDYAYTDDDDDSFHVGNGGNNDHKNNNNNNNNNNKLQPKATLVVNSSENGDRPITTTISRATFSIGDDSPKQTNKPYSTNRNLKPPTNITDL